MIKTVSYYVYIIYATFAKSVINETGILLVYFESKQMCPNAYFVSYNESQQYPCLVLFKKTISMITEVIYKLHIVF